MDLVARRRPLCTPVAISSTIPGSTTGLSPALRAATLSPSTSTPTTVWPLWARPAAVTAPTYPRPKTAIFIDSPKFECLPVPDRGLDSTHSDAAAGGAEEPLDPIDR